MGQLFGTDGIRGIANQELTPELVFDIARYGAAILKGDSEERPFILIGKDTRISSDLLETALISGILSVGVDVLPLGVVSTPAVSYLVRTMKATAGVMISASHNSSEYNGIKFFGPDGKKLPDALEDRIEEAYFSKIEVQRPIKGQVGKIIKPAKSPVEEYFKYVVSTVRPVSLSNLKIVLDCAHGSAYQLAPKMFAELGAEVRVINAQPDGININHNAGSLHPEKLQKVVLEEKANLGLAFDGDADRVIAVSEFGEVIDGDHIMAVCALDLMRKERLVKNTVVATVMSNLGFEKYLLERGINLLRAKVGDRYVLEEMEKGDYSLGGEQSGHIIFREYAVTGDGILTGLQLAKVLATTGKPLSFLTNEIPRYPQVLINVPVRDVKEYHNNERIAKYLESMQERMGSRGRVLVRPSGTEPLIRVMVESLNEEETKEVAENIASLIQKELS